MASGGLATLSAIYESFSAEYQKTPPRLRVLDVYAASALLTAAILFLYAQLVGTFPFNAFLAAFFTCLGVFVLTVSLRMQVSSGSGKDGAAFGGYALAMCTLFLSAWNYIG